MTKQWIEVAGATCVAVDDDHRFGEDALRLADFAAPARGERVCDLGTGCGAIALRLCTNFQPAAVHGIDIDPVAVSLATRGAQAFGGEIKPTFAVGDWEIPSTLGDSCAYDLVVCNPPYFPPSSGGVSANEARRLARHEREGTLPAVCTAAARLLRYGGRFCLCHRPERLVAVMAALTAAGLEPKRLRPVRHRAGDAPWLLLIEARRGGKSGLIWEEDTV